MAKILVNTRFLIKDKLEGIGRFTYETLRHMTANHPEHQFFFVFDRKWSDEFVFSKNVFPLKIGPQARHPILWYWWFEQSIPMVISRIKPDVFLSTDGYTTFKTRVKKVTVIHDLAFEHYPKDVNWLVRKYYKAFTPGYAEVSDQVATVSNFSKQDLMSTYHVPEDKISVVGNGASDYFMPLSDEEKTAGKAKYASGSPYFCFVGALQPRKNVATLFKAFDDFKANTGLPYKLVIVGRKAWKADAIFRTYENMQYKDDVVFTEHVPHTELRHIYGASKGLVFIPYFEGFGIPIIEAQQTGCPVITSNCTSMPEVAGDAALLVDPFDIEEVAAAMIQLASDDKMVHTLVEKGLENAKRYSWKLTAEKLWNVIEKVL